MVRVKVPYEKLKPNDITFIMYSMLNLLVIFIMGKGIYPMVHIVKYVFLNQYILRGR